MNKLWLLSTSLCAASVAISFYISSRRPPLVNYDSLVFFDWSPPKGPLHLLPDASSKGATELNILTPRTVDEMVAIVRAVTAAASGGGPKRKLRIVGAGHSWSAIAKSDDLQLSLSKYKGLVSVDKKLHQATFRGGTTFKEVNSILDKHGLAMSMLGSVSDQTVAGAIATGTHGSGITVGNLATLVVKLELVTSDGSILTLSADDDDKELFRAAQVSVGLLGIVTEVTFQCEPSFNIEETRSFVPLHTCLDNMDQLVYSAYQVKMWVEVISESCGLFQSNRTSDSPRDNPSPLIGNIHNGISEVIIGALAWSPSALPGGMKFLFKYGDPLPPYNRVDISHEVFNIYHYFPNHNEAEIVVDMKHCVPAIKELKEFVAREKIPLNFITEIRFVRQDEIPLSPNYMRDSCHLTLCIAHPSEADRLRYFQGIFRVLTDKNFEPRIHWGKYFDLSGVTVSTLYPKVDSFLKIRKQLDPYQIFTNELLEKTLGIV